MIHERMFNTVATISFPIVAFSTTSFHNSVTTTMFAAGDCKISKDYAGFTNTATTPTSDPDNKMVVLSLTAAELGAKHIAIYLVDQSNPKIWEDQAILIETYGTTTAQFAFSRDNSVIPASLSANQAVGIASVTSVDTVNNLGASAASQVYLQGLSASSVALTAVGVTTTAMTRLDKNVSSVSSFDPSVTTVKASLTAAQTGVTIATVTDITNTVKASLTAAQAGVTIATVTDITNTVKASLTAAQTGVTIAAVTSVINGVTLNTAGVAMVWDETATAHTVSTTMGGKLNAAGGAADPWATPLPGAYVTGSSGYIIGTNIDAHISSITSGGGAGATATAQAIMDMTLTSTSFAADTTGQRLTAIDNLLPASTISSFDVATTVKASLTAAQTGVTIATVTDVTNTVKASLTAAQTGVTIAAVTTVANVSGTIQASLTAAQTGVTIATVTQVTNQVQASLTASQAGVTIATVTAVTNPVTITSNADITAIKAKTDNLPDGVSKNVALNNFEFLMVDSADHITAKTGLGAGVTAERSIDGGAFGACANAVSEVGSGIYKINLAAADLNGDLITLKFTAAGADARYVTLKTEA
jgi:hypothetical protein